MDPITAGLFVAASVGTSLYASKNQAKIEAASIKMQTAQTKLQASETALERSKAFRNSLSSQLALSGMGMGSTTALATSMAESASNYSADIAALNMGVQFADAAGQAALATSKANQFVSGVNTGMNAAMLSQDLGLFSAPQSKKIRKRK